MMVVPSLQRYIVRPTVELKQQKCANVTISERYEYILFFWVLCRASISNVAMKLQKLILVDDGFTQE